MPFPRIFKKKLKELEREKEEKKVEEPAVKVQPQPIKLEQEPGKKMSGVESRPLKTKSCEAYRILKAPHVTEKATDLTKKNQYVFKVCPKANKTEIKKAIEDLYEVDVASVKIINVPPKKRRLGRISGWRKGYKKAIIQIKEGQKIEVLPR